MSLFSFRGSREASPRTLQGPTLQFSPSVGYQRPTFRCRDDRTASILAHASAWNDRSSIDNAAEAAPSNVRDDPGGALFAGGSLSLEIFRNPVRLGPKVSSCGLAGAGFKHIDRIPGSILASRKGRHVTRTRETSQSVWEEMRFWHSVVFFAEFFVRYAK